MVDWLCSIQSLRIMKQFNYYNCYKERNCPKTLLCGLLYDTVSILIIMLKCHFRILTSAWSGKYRKHNFCSLYLLFVPLNNNFDGSKTDNISVFVRVCDGNHVGVHHLNASFTICKTPLTAGNQLSLESFTGPSVCFSCTAYLLFEAKVFVYIKICWDIENEKTVMDDRCFRRHV